MSYKIQMHYKASEEIYLKHFEACYQVYVLPENFIEMEHNEKSAEIKRLQEILAGMKQRVQVQNCERKNFEDSLKKSYRKILAKMAEEIRDTDFRNLTKIEEFKDKHKISLEQDKIHIRNNALKTYRIHLENLEKTANERMKQILQESQNAVDILKRKDSEVESLQKQFYNLDVRVENQECDLTKTEMTEEINDLKQVLKQLVDANIAVQNEWSRNIFIAVVMNDEEELVPLKEVLNQWINRVKKQQNKKDRLISEWRHKFNKHQERIIRTHQEDMDELLSRHIEQIDEMKTEHKQFVEKTVDVIRRKISTPNVQTRIECLEKGHEEFLRKFTNEINELEWQLDEKMDEEADLKQKLAGLETYEKELSHMKTSEITILEETRKNMIEWYKSAIEEWRINALNVNGRKNEIARALGNVYEFYKEDQTLLSQYKIVWQRYKDRLSEQTHK